nr:gas vesicle protein GvpD [Candidatus Njordarchaeum guaymaensis]
MLAGGELNLSLGRVQTGTDALDEITEGGFPRGSLIILAGNPGSGKTVFAANFLCKGTRLNEVGVFASFVESKENFAVNMSKHFGTDCEECIRSGKVVFLDLATLREGGAPTVLQTILDKVERTGAKRLVMDSYSALSLAFDRKLDARVIIQTILGKVVRHLGCTTILVVEIPFGENHVGTGVEEFIADGVIKLGADVLDGRLLRTLEVVKLRGTRLAERKLLFTLEGGIKVLPPFRVFPVDKPQRFRPIPDPPGRFSTGSEQLDRILGGGYPIFSTVLFEVESGVTTVQSQLVLAQTVRNFMAKGRTGIMIPSSGVDYKVLKPQALRVGFTEEEVNRQLRICILRSSETAKEPYLVALDGENIEQDNQRISELEDDRMKETKQPLVSATAYDPRIAIYGLDAAMKMAMIEAARVRQKGNLAITVLRPGYGAASVILGEVVDVHLKIAERHGAVVLYGIKPRTNLYVVEMDTSRGYSVPKLTSVV